MRSLRVTWMKRTRPKVADWNQVPGRCIIQREEEKMAVSIGNDGNICYWAKKALFGIFLCFLFVWRFCLDIVREFVWSTGSGGRYPLGRLFCVSWMAFCFQAYTTLAIVYISLLCEIEYLENDVPIDFLRYVTQLYDDLWATQITRICKYPIQLPPLRR